MTDAIRFKASAYIQALWIEWLKRSADEQSRYHFYLAYDYAGMPDLPRLGRALQIMVNTHYNLRSSFVEEAGEIYQLIDEKVEAALTHIITYNQEEYQSALDKYIALPFNLSQPPLFRFVLIEKRDEARSTLLFNFHHIILDGTQHAKMLAVLEKYYHRHDPADLALTDKGEIALLQEYLAWEKEKIAAADINYWVNKLKDYPWQIDLPYHPDNAVKPFKDITSSYTLDKALYQRLKQFIKEQDCSIFHIMQILLAHLMCDYADQDKVVLRYAFNTRRKKFADIKGDFVNTLFFCFEKKGRFLDCLASAQKDNGWLENAYVNVVDVMAKLKPEGRIFPVNLAQVTVYEGPCLQGPAHYLPRVVIAGSDLFLPYEDTGEELKFKITTPAGLWDKDFLERIPVHLSALLEKVLADPQIDLAALNCLSADEYAQISQRWNATEADYPADQTLQQLFEAQVARTPDAVAVVYQDDKLTYQELNAKANHLAGIIGEQAPDTLIAICVERSFEMMIGLLAILKSGAAYVPIDPSYPKERIDYILKDTQARLVLTQSHVASLFASSSVKTLLLDTLHYPVKSAHFPLSGQAHQLAYVIYTSGTTGAPKGVMIEHQSVVNHLYWRIKEFNITAKDVILQKTFFGFDISVFEFFLPLIAGAKLIMPKQDAQRDMDYLLDCIHREEVTLVQFVPSLLELLLNTAIEKNACHQLSSLRVVFSGGEALKLNLKKRFEESLNAQLVNVYGPTETTIDTTFYYCRKGNHQVLIGKPIANARCYVYDQHLNLVPLGVTGELYVAGDGLARGYLNQPKLTQERFVVKDGERLYKTGDLVKWQREGNLEYIGRNDFQVKLHGYRIELQEIENALNDYPYITQSVVLLKEHAGNPYLVAYYVSPLAEKPEFLIEFLAQSLPEYMVPKVFVHLQQLPLTDNGKLDKKAMPEPLLAPDAKHYLAPRNTLEDNMQKIWQEVLGIEQIGVEDDFFFIGGDSIVSIQLGSKLHQAGFAVGPREIFECRTIAKLVQHLERHKAKVIVAEQGVLEGAFDLLPIQQSFFEWRLPTPNYYNQAFLVMTPLLDKDWIDHALRQLVTQHDMLRICFEKDTGGSYRQRYLKAISIPTVFQLDVSTLDQETIFQTLSMWQSHFDIEKGPLWQVGYLFGYPDQSARLFFALHHLIVDGVTWRILMDDLKKIYEGKPLGEKTSSYRQWMRAVKNYVVEHSDEIAYWQEVTRGLPDESTYTLEAPAYYQPILGERETSLLLHESNKAFQTEINDLLLTALAYALKDWHQHDVSHIILDSHGRVALDEALDVSRTLGWFTAEYPVKLKLSATLADSIVAIKQILREVPLKGLGDSAFRRYGNLSGPMPMIEFNYLGQFDQAGGWWQLAPERPGAMHPTENVHHLLLNINALVINNRLQVWITSRIKEGEKFAENYLLRLQQVIAHCSSAR